MYIRRMKVKEVCILLPGDFLQGSILESHGHNMQMWVSWSGSLHYMVMHGFTG